jgi:hypothetical protein
MLGNSVVRGNSCPLLHRAIPFVPSWLTRVSAEGAVRTRAGSDCLFRRANKRKPRRSGAQRSVKAGCSASEDLWREPMLWSCLSHINGSDVSLPPNSNLPLAGVSSHRYFWFVEFFRVLFLLMCFLFLFGHRGRVSCIAVVVCLLGGQARGAHFGLCCR